MNGSSQEAWFYTANGARTGPVTRSELQAMAASGKLNPRYDHCWTNGMDQWRPAGEIDGLFAKSQNEPQNAKPTLAGQSSVTTQRHQSKLSERELEHELREAKWPGASRRVYLFGTWIMPIIVAAAFAGLAWFLFDPESPEDIAIVPILYSVASLAVFCIIIFVWLQRFQNLGMSRWWLLGTLVPLLNIWLGYRTMCCPAGYEYHRKLDGIGVFLAIIYWGILLLAILAVVVSILALLGLVGGGMMPELDGLRERLMEEMEQFEGSGASPGE